MAIRDVGTELLTIAEVAKLFRVSTMSVQRWLKQGRIPGYRVGARGIRIRREDLKQLMALLSHQGSRPAYRSLPMHTNLEAIPRPTEEDKKRQLEAIEAARAFRKELVTSRGGKPFDESWPLIRKARVERSKQLEGRRGDRH